MKSIKKIVSNLALKSVRSTLVIMLCFASSGYAQSEAGALPPLSPQELEAVIQEIKAMVKTDESLADEFVVREATPARIDRLYQMPEFIRQPRVIRENGLIFAGRASLLKFDKPSDVISKLSTWFPKEIAAAHAAQTKSPVPFFGEIGLYGPFPGWQDEPAAFLALWNCMPQIAWLRPTQNPFMRRRTDGLPFMSIADRSSGQFNFGACVHERSGRRFARTKEDIPVIKNEMRAIGNRVTPVLRSKFARFLSTSRCQGTGPDDCVLILLLWSSLSPADAELAHAIHALESDVSPGGPLPKLQKPINQYERVEQEGEPHFDEGLRKAAFLRAKLLSVLHAKDAWSPQALQTTLQQITRLLQMFEVAKNFRWRRFDIGPDNAEVDPRYALFTAEGKTPRVQAAVMEELESLASDAYCDVLNKWLEGGGKSLRATFALHHLTDKPPLRCVGPDWAWLKQGESAEARDLRNQYLNLLGHVESGAVHERLLSEFTDYGNGCFDKEGEPSQDWLREVCKTWVAEPQAVPFTLKHSRLILKDENKFHATQLQLPTASDTEPADIAAWLTKLVQGMNDEAQQKMQAFIADLKRRKGSVHAATWWKHPRHDKSLVELRLYRNDEPSNPVWPCTGPQILLVFEAQTLTLVGVPERFRGRNDDREIVHISDLDEDGNLEVWWAESFRKCQGDDSDLEREIDCAARMAEMGEIKGDALSYFSNTHDANKSSGVRKAATSNVALMAARVPANTRDDQRSCNAVLIGSVLGDKPGFNFRMRVNEGDVIDLVCKTHPVHPEQTIVALFHELKDKQGNDVGEDKKGFMLAVIDVRRRKLLSQYRNTIEEDATTRISDHSLQIDTGRYKLAPSVRAFGVRMNIGYSPRYAEGGSSGFLTLFIEEGKQLKPVLKDLPMSLWTITEGSNDDNAAYTMDSVELSLAMSPTSTNGWHDIEATAHHQVEMGEGGADAAAKKQTRKQLLGKLRANGKMYSAEGGWVRSSLWPDR